MKWLERLEKDFDYTYCVPGIVENTFCYLVYWCDKQDWEDRIITVVISNYPFKGQETHRVNFNEWRDKLVRMNNKRR